MKYKKWLFPTKQKLKIYTYINIYNNFYSSIVRKQKINL